MDEKPWIEYYKDKKDRVFMSKLFYYFVCIIMALFVALYFLNYYFNLNYSYITINGRSMQPTLNPNPYTVVTGIVNGEKKTETIQDGVYINHKKDATYGDIIVIENVFPTKTIIKRVLAFEGDYVSIVKVEVKEDIFQYRLMRMKNGSDEVEVLEESYIKSHYEWVNTYYENQPQDIETPQVIYEPFFYPTFSNGYDSKIVNVEEYGFDVKFFQVPEGEIFYLGDNRTNSSDSRDKDLGTTEKNNILGKVVKIVRNGAACDKNGLWWLNRAGGYFSVIWDNILEFFKGK